MSARTEEPCYSTRLDEAIALATREFRHERRKGSGIPYLSHLLQVMVTVAEHGGDEDQLIAAVLHDYLEDVAEATPEMVEARFGPRVREYVVGLSDAVTLPKPPWRERKERYLAALRHKDPALKLISAADKHHNATSILRDHRAVGDALWSRFTADRDQTLWYYRAVVEALGHGWEHALLDDLVDVVRRIHADVGVPYP